MSLTHSPENQSASPARWPARLAAICEICGVYMVGQLLAFLLIGLLGIELTNPIETLKTNPNADLLEMSKTLAGILFLQYGGIMLPALGIGWWYRRRRLSEYGLTVGQPLFPTGKPILGQLLTGVVLFAVAELPGKLLIVLDRFIPLGQKAVTQQIAYNLDWGTYQFWIFMAVGSFLLIPIVEEFFYRGYVQTRLAEDFDAPTAILATALFFTLSHGQYYLTLSPWTLGTLLTSLFGSLVWGYAFYRTRSLLAVIVAHALVNFPVRGIAEFILPGLMVMVIIFYRAQIRAAFHQFGALFKSEGLTKLWMVFVSLFFSLFALLVTLAEDLALLFGIFTLVVALVLEWNEKRKSKTQEPAKLETA